MYLDLITDVIVRADAFMCACVRACMVWGVWGGYVCSSCVRACVLAYVLACVRACVHSIIDIGAFVVTCKIRRTEIIVIIVK